jgi:uncharacterized protein YggE
MAEMPPDGIAPSITVRGDARMRTEPDEAVLWVSLSALEAAPGAALSDVSGRSDALVALLDELGVARADRSTAGITVEEEWDHTEQGRRSLGHRATARISVRLTDPEQMGRLIARATEELGARIDGPRWLVSLDNPVWLEAARQASADARRKAEAYAEGIGAGLGRLMALSQPRTSPPAAFGVALSGQARMAARREMPVEAGEHEVAAAIEATFALELD